MAAHNLEDAGLGPAAEDVVKCIADLAYGDIRLDRVDDERHCVLAPTRRVPERVEARAGLGVIALTPQPG